MATPRTISDQLALLLGQWFGCGLSPRAPGTIGSLGALPLFWVLSQQSLSVYWGTTILLSLGGFWVSERCSVLLQEKDPQRVVLDEVAGVLIALGFVLSSSFPILLLAWGLFRLFDITKPGLIDKVQHLKPNGVGIMADDLLAGLVAGLLAYGVQLLLP